MENQTSSVESLIDRVKSYVETRIELLKLKAIDKSSSFVSTLVSMVFVVVMMTLMVILLSVGVSLWLGECFGKSYYGFFAVAGFYLITGLLIFLFQDKWLKPPIANKMIKKLLDK